MTDLLDHSAQVGNSRQLRVLLISTYDLGHQPFGLASPAAWLAAAGARVACLDLAADKLDEDLVRDADLIAFYLPMHTATRIATRLVPRVRQLNPDAHLSAYGLYAPVNDAFLRELGVHSVIGGEFEEPLVELVRDLQQPQTHVVSLARQEFKVPLRDGLPGLGSYAYLTLPDGSRRVAGYTEATRGCKHLCRHCPIVPVYGGKFRVVQREVVLADIRQQVEAGAQHITFGDPDFFNGPRHALALVTALHEEFPDLTYDVTIKIEHLVRHLDRLPLLRDTGCILVTSAVESIEERILDAFDKRHSHEDFTAVVQAFREQDLHLNPTFVAFTPWTSLEGYWRFLTEIHDLGLVRNVAPVQYAIRLLIPEGSRLLQLAEVRSLVGQFDRESLCYPWAQPDPRVDALQRDVLTVVTDGLAADRTRIEVFSEVSAIAAERCGRPAGAIDVDLARQSGPVPQPSEPWYCCAEPTEEQLAPI